ncbi:GNAT family N-acetyltransferase [Entomomonas asaccharolytica]|uniref:N-acetyltransferase n=1 Tax=Entomomonas asaccharolytica TaxID=2785331 RepID=A0A974NG31_9GAMM|nr:GNAT family N-acetyltransferase [Entomomonas asaccharolytica]QQP85996.1 N-acetyltransferase [Entomomonas asaccharolytica]
MTDSAVEIIHDAIEHQFKVNINEKCAYLAYANMGDRTIDCYRTFVPETLRGKGIAAKLTNAVLDYAEQNSLKIIPTCSYVEKYMQSKGLI